jgi:lysophospholipase L1-like esterase
MTPPPTYLHIAALGSSFAAGPGIDPIVDRAAGRSARNYPHLLAEALGAHLTDLSVSGATTATLVDQQQRMLARTFPPQLDGVPADADLVTITAGGNDLNYALSLLKAGWGGWFQTRGVTRALGRRLSRNPLPQVGDAEIDKAADGLARVVAAVRTKAPGARILLVDYLTVIGNDSEPSPELPFEAQVIDGFRTIGLQLAEAFEAAASQSGAELVKITALSASHGVGSAEAWITGFEPRLRGYVPYHPNAVGMRAVADELVRVVSAPAPSPLR